jgi:hypothetical protein
MRLGPATGTDALWPPASAGDLTVTTFTATPLAGTLPR